LPRGACGHAGLAEAAASRAAAHDLDRDPVMHGINIWNDEPSCRWGELGDNPFHDWQWCTMLKFALQNRLLLRIQEQQRRRRNQQWVRSKKNDIINHYSYSYLYFYLWTSLILLARLLAWQN
jgi:hypothetical protein